MREGNVPPLSAASRAPGPSSGPSSLIAGAEIYNFEQLESFIVNVVSENDSFKERREKIRNYIYEYHDANSSKRLVELLGL